MIALMTGNIGRAFMIVQLEKAGKQDRTPSWPATITQWLCRVCGGEGCRLRQASLAHP